jgi:hypothetical protein
MNRNSRHFSRRRRPFSSAGSEQCSRRNNEARLKLSSPQEYKLARPLTTKPQSCSEDVVSKEASSGDTSAISWESGAVIVI